MSDPWKTASGCAIPECAEPDTGIGSANHRMVVIKFDKTCNGAHVGDVDMAPSTNV
jgi:hypothetical protein